MYTFLSIKRHRVLYQEISRNLILIKRYQKKRDRGKKRENTRERVRQRKRRRERERKRAKVGVLIILCKKNRLVPPLLLLLLFGNQNRLVILIILVAGLLRPQHLLQHSPAPPRTQAFCNRIAARQWWWETGHRRVQGAVPTWQTDWSKTGCLLRKPITYISQKRVRIPCTIRVVP